MKDYYEENSLETETENVNEQNHLEKTVLYTPADSVNEYDDTTAPFDREEKQSLFQRKWFKRLLTIVLFLCIVGVVGIGYFNKLAGSKIDAREEDKFLNKVNASKGLSASEHFDKNTINLLFFGTDRDAGREKSGKYGSIYRPDTIILASINLEKQTISMTSIPRDTYVPLYGNRGKARVNATMYYGSIYGKTGTVFDKGVDCLQQTVSALFGGVPIDYYVGVDMDAVVKIVDAMGGVKYDVPYNIYYRGKVMIPKGEQVLDGYHFMFLARDRENAGSDIHRVAMQQKLMKTLFQQFKESNKFMSVPTLYNAMKDDIFTNMSFEQIVALAVAVKDIQSENITTHTFPGTYGSRDGQSLWIISQSRRVALIKELFGIDAKPWPQEAARE
ncbi:MAG: LCP family protein [Eubacteriaceae bacterium]|jgi:LCP family protein required for cell wall assembly|nr:LCP family protein [Eubacteriaceae bacterium]